MLESPLRTLVTFMYSILLFFRGPAFKPPRNKPVVRVVCISDTHSNVVSVPHGDLLIHAGDLTNAGTVEQIQAQIDWLASLPHREKIMIAGNHDSFFDAKSRKPEDEGKKLDFKGIHYLENKAVVLKFKGGRRLKFYGAPDIPFIGGVEHACVHALLITVVLQLTEYRFQYKIDQAPWENRVPRDTDVLITHTPPRYHLDLNMGCASLLAEIWRVKPRLHVFGHIHSGHGREAVFWDEGQASYEQVKIKTGNGILRDFVPSTAWIDAIKVLFYGVRGILWDRLMVGPGGSNGCLMVNAAIVWQSTTAVGNTPEVVEL